MLSLVCNCGGSECEEMDIPRRYVILDGLDMHIIGRTPETHPSINYYTSSRALIRRSAEHL